MIKLSKEKGHEFTVNALLEKAFHVYPNKEVIYDGKRRLTYQNLQEESTWLAASLWQLGIKKGDRVAVCLPNSHEFITILFALSKLGAILIPLNTQFKSEEIEYIVKDSGTKLAFISEKVDSINHLQMFSDIQKQAVSLEQLITVRYHANGYKSYTELLHSGAEYELERAKIDKEDIMAIIYTSGTTGKPKGVMLSNQNVVHIAKTASKKMQCTPEDVFLIPVPLFHVMGMMFILRTVYSQACLVLMEKFKAEKALALIEKEKVTIHPGVPTMFILELQHPSFSKFDLSSLRIGEMAAAPCPVEIVRQIRSKMGCNILVAYGLTETSANVTLTDFTDDDISRSETVGRAVEGVELKVVDQNRQPVKPGEVGELACKSIGLMKGYYNAQERTAEVMDEEGFFYTGDLVTMDEAGYVRIVGRKKEMIIRGGFNVYPREIEEVFYQHDYVSEAAIIGLPDTVLGEIVCAVIHLKDGHSISEAELKEFAKQKLVKYKVPDKIIFLDQMPMTSSGKILKIELQAVLKEELKSQLR